MLDFLHLGTLGVTTSILLLALSGLMLFFFLTRKTYAGFAFWTASMALIAIGLILIISRNALPPWIGILLANYLALAGIAVFYDGLVLFQKGKLNWKTNGSLHLCIIASIAIVAYFLYVEDNINARIVCVNIVRLALMLLCLVNVYRAPRNAAYSLLGMTFAISAIESSARIGMAIFDGPIGTLQRDTSLRMLLLIDGVLVLFMMFSVLVLTQNRVERQLAEALKAAERASRIDALTGLWNRFHFESVVRQETERTHRYGSPASLLLIDIDHFKRVNDTFGHLAGDAVLKELAKRATAVLRATDLVYRWGGEEFIVLLPSTLEGATQAAEKLRQAIAATPFADVGAVTISIGVAQYRSKESLSDWTDRVDQALYRAKAKGRNRVEQESDDIVSKAFPLSLQWNPAFSSGNATIDAQHKEIFEVANLLLERCAAHDASGAIDIMQKLLKDTHIHFNYEEAVLADLAYPGLDGHRQEHECLRQLGEEILNRMKMADSTRGDLLELSDFVISKLALGHIAEEDALYVGLFQQRESAVMPQE